MFQHLGVIVGATRRVGRDPWVRGCACREAMLRGDSSRRSIGWLFARLAQRDDGAPARDASGASWACALLRGLALDGRHFQPSGLPPTEVKLDPRAQSSPLWPRDARFVELGSSPARRASSPFSYLAHPACVDATGLFSDVMQRSGRRHRFFDAMVCRCGDGESRRRVVHDEALTICPLALSSAERASSSLAHAQPARLRRRGGSWRRLLAL